MVQTSALDMVLRVADIVNALYDRAETAPGLLSDATTVVERIRAEKAGHVDALLAAGASGPRVSPAAIDFTAGGGTGAGPFSAVFEDIGEFLRVAQLLEDLAVRSYKRQLQVLRDDDAYATLLAIHAATGRHAAAIRRLRQTVGFAFLKPWITGVSPGFDFSSTAPPNAVHSPLSVARLVYGEPAELPGATTGEDNLVQGPIRFPDAPSANTEAFDEPMTAEQTTAVITLFVP